MHELAMLLPLAAVGTPGAPTSGIAAERPSGTGVVAPPPGGETVVAPGATATTGTGATTGTATSTAPASQPAPTGGGLFGGMFLPIILMLVVMYFVLFRGQRKDEKKRKAMIAELKKGDRVMTIGGMLAKVVSVEGDEVVLKVDEAANVKETYRKSAIQEVLDRDEKK